MKEDEIGRDPRLSEALRVLDPASGDPGYWLRFHAGVMAATRDELARRRMLADVTVSELVTSWGRMLVPTAVLAAAVAAFLLLQPGGVPRPAPVAPLALEEMFEQELAVPTLRADVDDRMSVTVAAEVF
ncbi:MAG: hypothetical protein PVI57_01570 [Gemmatimonadota bacterium]|jgi:hypothetical protein